MGVSLSDVDGSVLGHLAVLDVRPMPDDPICRAMFEIFAGRAAAELRRIRVERQVRARQAQLAGLIESAQDAIVQLDGELRVTGMNPAAERTFETPAELARGMPLPALISPADAARLEGLLRDLQGRPQNARSAWVPGGFTGLKVGGGTFLAEGTLSLFEVDRRRHVTLILRNIDERLETERRIRQPDQRDRISPHRAAGPRALRGDHRKQRAPSPRARRGAPGRAGGHGGAHPRGDRTGKGSSPGHPRGRAARPSRW
jgi:PAS domain S-box-containing protein